MWDLLFDPNCRSMLINLKGQGSSLDREGIPKPATTNAEEHLLSVRHTKLSPRSPSQPSRAWETAQSQGQPPQSQWWLDTAWKGNCQIAQWSIHIFTPPLNVWKSIINYRKKYIYFFHFFLLIVQDIKKFRIMTHNVGKKRGVIEIIELQAFLVLRG